ncbi:MAG: alkaline phosphatase family protein, partial [Thermoanaerobaculia bacterium]|nr:alkaline phosphatase family protein [Thermoanaerobaculia bacterium]
MSRCGLRAPCLAAGLAILAATASGASSSPVRGRAPGGAAKPRVIFVGWDGADWKLLETLLKQGRLPNFAALVARGRTWNLGTYQPMSSPLIWTTMATGRSPLEHGVGDFQEVDPQTRRRLPISGRSRRVPAIWNLASSKGVSVGVVGWWATWPAEKVDGFFVSDRAAPVLFDPGALVMSDALTWPEGLAEGVRIVARREEKLGFEEVAKALRVTRAEHDAAVRADRSLEDPITGYRKILVTTRIHARIALDLYEREKPELLMVYFQGTDEIGHVAGRFAPPKLPSVPEADYRRFSGAVEAVYAEHDRILGRFREKALRDGATLLVASDHGFKWGDDRPVSAGSGVGFDTAFLWHEDPGMMAAEGPAIVPGRERGRASVFDVVPTLCRILGLSPDPAFEGRPVSGLGGPALPKPAPAVSWEKTVRV